MKKQIIISQEPKVVTKRGGDVLAYYVAFARSFGQSQTHDRKEDGTIFQKEITNIGFSVRQFPADKLETITNEDILNLTNGVVSVDESETYEVDLSKMPLPKFVLKDFTNSEEMQAFITGFYLQTVLNEGKDYSITNWIIKQ